MSTKKISFLAFTHASFTLSQPVSTSILEDTPLANECTGKVVGDDCTVPMGVFDVGGKCEGALVTRILWKVVLRGDCS
jgi:hypothetical protein